MSVLDDRPDLPEPLAVATRRAATLGRSLADWLPCTVRAGTTGALALVLVSATVVAAVRNAPGTTAEVGPLRAVVAPAAALLPGVAALTVATASHRPLERVGLLFAGTFGLLATVDPAAALPATAAVPLGGTLVLVATSDRTPFVARGVAGVVLVGTLATLAAGVGLAPASAHAVGSGLALLGIAGAPAFVAPDLPEWALGGLLAGATLWVGTTAPSVTGAVALVAGGVVGVPFALVAIAVGGAVAAVAAAVRRRRWGVAAGVVVLLAAGVPGSVPAAAAVVVGLAALLGPRSESGHRPAPANGGDPA